MLDLKLVAIGVVALLAIGGVLAYGHRQYERGVDDTTQAQMKAMGLERAERKRVDWEVRKGYEARIAQLNALAGIERSGAAIHCVLNAPGEVRSGRDSAGPAESAGGEPAVRAAKDLRPELVRVGQQCEQLRQQLIAISARQEALKAADR